LRIRDNPRVPNATFDKRAARTHPEVIRKGARIVFMGKTLQGQVGTMGRVPQVLSARSVVSLSGMILALTPVMKMAKDSPSPVTCRALADLERGFPANRLDGPREPKVKKDDRGFYIMTLSENIKVYFEDYYQLLELLASRCAAELEHVSAAMASCPDNHPESMSYYRARRIIVELVYKNVRAFYSDRHNFGVIMTPWCLGTVMLEKVELVRDRLARGELNHPDVGEYPYDVVRYMDEIRTRTLMDLFDFPPKAFAMRWQYTELIKRYSQALTNVTTSLQNILELMKNYGK
jgi:hypothetical protein